MSKKEQEKVEQEKASYYDKRLERLLFNVIPAERLLQTFFSELCAEFKLTGTEAVEVLFRGFKSGLLVKRLIKKEQEKVEQEKVEQEKVEQEKVEQEKVSYWKKFLMIR